MHNYITNLVKSLEGEMLEEFKMVRGIGDGELGECLDHKFFWALIGAPIYFKCCDSSHYEYQILKLVFEYEQSICCINMHLCERQESVSTERQVLNYRHCSFHHSQFAPSESSVCLANTQIFADQTHLAEVSCSEMAFPDLTWFGETNSVRVNEM
jgi:hypothetical protein